ncbi:hypothetical protein GCM10022377_12980 [Zhihengliuella alba]|uniref:Uncharacterized protein n=1 Tax=Zhihengliuella alba TaxID=547018 RepID=A0ABP7D8P9_9MICC
MGTTESTRRGLGTTAVDAVAAAAVSPSGRGGRRAPRRSARSVGSRLLGPLLAAAVLCGVGACAPPAEPALALLDTPASTQEIPDQILEAGFMEPASIRFAGADQDGIEYYLGRSNQADEVCVAIFSPERTYEFSGGCAPLEPETFALVQAVTTPPRVAHLVADGYTPPAEDGLSRVSDNVWVEIQEQ